MIKDYNELKKMNRGENQDEIFDKSLKVSAYNNDYIDEKLLLEVI